MPCIFHNFSYLQLKQKYTYAYKLHTLQFQMLLSSGAGRIWVKQRVKSSLQHPKHSVSISTGHTEKTGKWLWLSVTYWTSSLVLLEGRDVIMLCRKQSWIFPWLPFTEPLRKASVKSELWISKAKLNHTDTIEREITCRANSQCNSIFVCSVHSAFNYFCSQLPHVWIQWPRQPMPRHVFQIIPVPVNWRRFTELRAVTCSWSTG